jgi:hypothetical protein
MSGNSWVSVEIPKSAKQFLIKLVPQLLRACGVSPEQSFYGFKFNIQAEATRRISVMKEEDARCALESLKELLKEW